MIGDWKGKGHLGKAPRVLRFLQHSPRDTEYSGGKIGIHHIVRLTYHENSVAYIMETLLYEKIFFPGDG
jgi:hypothetical protein